jgi:flavodoxin
MRAVLIFDSQFGNTEQIAHAIARGLAEHGSVDVLTASTIVGQSRERPDLLVVGGPTQRHGTSPTLRAYFAALPDGDLHGVRAATFDTRYRMPSLLSGSAARLAAGRLRHAGCRLIAGPESFFVERDRPPEDTQRRHALERLEPGELERAIEWGRSLAVTVVAAIAAPASSTTAPATAD